MTFLSVLQWCSVKWVCYMLFEYSILNIQAIINQELCMQVEMTQCLVLFLKPSVPEHCIQQYAYSLFPTKWALFPLSLGAS